MHTQNAYNGLYYGSSTKILTLVVTEAILLKYHPSRFGMLLPGIKASCAHPGPPPKKKTASQDIPTYTVVKVDGATPQRWLSKGL